MVGTIPDSSTGGQEQSNRIESEFNLLHNLCDSGHAEGFASHAS